MRERGDGRREGGWREWPARRGRSSATHARPAVNWVAETKVRRNSPPQADRLVYGGQTDL